GAFHAHEAPRLPTRRPTAVGAGRSRSDGGRVRCAGGDHRPGRGGVARAGGAFRRPVGGPSPESLPERFPEPFPESLPEPCPEQFLDAGSRRPAADHLTPELDQLPPPPDENPSGTQCSLKPFARPMP